MNQDTKLLVLVFICLLLGTGFFVFGLSLIDKLSKSNLWFSIILIFPLLAVTTIIVLIPFKIFGLGFLFPPDEKIKSAHNTYKVQKHKVYKGK